MGESVKPGKLNFVHYRNNAAWDPSDSPVWEELETLIDTINNFAEAITASFSSFGLFIPDESTVIEEYNSLPNEFTLKQNFPNPFNPSTVIESHIPDAGFVNIKVFNILGQKVAHPVEAVLSAGVHSVVFDGSSLGSGLYF